MKTLFWRALSSIGATVFFFFVAHAQELSAADVTAPSLALKREFRGAWIATVLNLDWPSSGGASVTTQKSELVTILDKLKDAGFNAVIFQVRSESDAMYNSPYEPWSYWLTGAQGRAPNPYYDPLQFAVEEAHKRGMELHAWFNPYRCVRQTDANTSDWYQKAANHVSIVHPEWLLGFSQVHIAILNPGLPQVRDYVSSVVSDIVRRYDVDGVHADDYFYPYPDGSFVGITNEDASTFSQYSRGFTNLGDWRRDNVNLLIKQISDSVKAIKPNVKFGMSPFGIWKSGVPAGITGLDAYSTIYCDAPAWLRNKSVDYITPQLYWAFGGGQDYAKLQPWWADSANANGRHFYTGNATYRINTAPNPFSTSEIPNQINFNRANPKVQGSIQFRALNVTGNLGGISDLLKSDVYSYASIIPTMPWKPDGIPPNAPVALQVTTSGLNSYGLQWTSPPAAADGDSARRFAVYRFNSQTPQQVDRDKPRNLLLLTGITTTPLPYVVDSVGVQYYYAITSVDKNNNESVLTSNVSPITGSSAAIAAQTSPLSPANGNQTFPKGGTIKWSKSSAALAYKLEFDSTQSLGSSSMVSIGTLTDTAYIPSGLAAQKTYYWRVAAGNQVGASIFSPFSSFRAGWPLPPTLISPNGASGVSRNPTFVWTKGVGTSFQLRVKNNATHAVVLDTTLTDSICTSGRILDPAPTIFAWTVTAFNSAGASDLSAEGRFQTVTSVPIMSDGGIPTEFFLSQNYPNPFNPTTTILFSLPQQGRVELRIYDMLGREVATLLDGKEINPGNYRVQWNGRNQYGESVATGIYFYRIVAGGFIQSKKMILLK
jgi:uncharacterized lipoprotein YddW (UPF0748 family)